MRALTPARTLSALRLSRVAMAAVLALVIALGSAFAQSAETQLLTRVIIVRHAEKAVPAEPGTMGASSADPELTEGGLARAERLATMVAGWLSGRQLDVIYATTWRRTQQTAAPSARRYRLPVQTTPEGSPEASMRALAATIRAEHQGKAVLVVGHSNTVTLLVQLLGGPEQPVIGDNEYDRVYLLSLDAKGTLTVERARY